MVIIREIKNKSCQLYDPNDNLIGEFDSDLIFNDIRIQIKEQQLKGYYLIFEDKKIKIDSNGNLASYPNGLFDTYIDQLCKLI